MFSSDAMSAGPFLDWIACVQARHITEQRNMQMSPVQTLNPVPRHSFLIYVDWKVSHVRSRGADVNLQIN